MASNSKQMNMSALFLITSVGLLLLAAGIIFAQGIYLQSKQSIRFSPETAGATLSQAPGEGAELFAKQESALRAGHLDEAIAAEIAAANAR